MIVKELFARLGLDLDEVGFSKADAAIAGLHKGFVAFGAAAIGALAVGAVALAKSTADAATQANALAQSTGLDLTTIQQFGFAAQSVGISVEEMAHGLNHLAKTGVRDVRAEVLRLANQFKTMPDDGRKVALAMAKFGRAGAQLIPLLNKGGDAIGDLADEATELGLVFSKEDVEAAKDFKHELHLFTGAIRGAAFAVGKLLLPPLTRILRSINELIKDFREAGPIFHKVSLVLRGLAFVLSAVLLAALIANIEAIGVAIAEYVALGAAAVFAGLKAAASWAAVALPIVALIALIAVLLAIAEDVYYFFTEGDSLIGEIGPAWTKFIDEFTAPHSGDPWWLAVLRRALRVVTDLQVEIPKLIEMLSPANIPSVLAALGSAFQQQGLSGVNNVASQIIGGGAAGPSASAGLTPVGKILAPQFNAQITVNASPGMSPQDVAGHVAQALDQHFDSKMRQAAAGTSP